MESPRGIILIVAAVAETKNIWREKTKTKIEKRPSFPFI
jgi:hypothetical protein